MNTKTVVLDLKFASPARYGRFRRELSKAPDVRSNILRGRVSPGGAWLQLELSGGSEDVDRLLSRWRAA